MRLLEQLLSAGHPRTRDALDELWQNLPENPNICWYPSAGSCFRDLLIWNHYPALAEVPEPDLYIHTDYGPPNRVPNDFEDDRTRITLQLRDRLELSSEVIYQVEPTYASHAGAAAERPVVELLHVHAESKTVGVINKPVLYFHFENFNWFEEFALKRELQISHIFKLREGCGMGGARTSVSNLYPLLAKIGCHHLIADQEVHLSNSVLHRFLSANASGGATPFQIERKGAIGELSEMHVDAFRVRPGSDRQDWIEDVLHTITLGSTWEKNAGKPRSGRS